MNKKTKIIIYVIVAIVALALATKALKQNDGIKPEILDKVVILNEAKVSPENDGKLVLISGKLETDYTLTDEDLGLQIDSCKAERKVEMYQYAIKNDTLDYKWDDDVKEYVVIDSKRYYNPNKSMDDLETCDIAQLGEFTVPEGLTKKLSYNSNVKDLPEVKRYRIKNDYLTNTSGIDKIGDIRIKYNYVDLDKTGEVSILAKQVGDSFEEYKLDTGYNVFNLYQNKITNKEELAKELDKDMNTMYGGIIIVIIIILIVGVFIFKEDLKNIINKSKNKKENA